MFLGIPGITNVASGMTAEGERFSYTIFDSQIKLEAARAAIMTRLADVDMSGRLLEADKVVQPIKENQ